MTKSLCVSWISSCDYPLFRKWLDKYGNRFDEILIYWDLQFRYPFFNAFIQQSLSHLSNVKFIDKEEGVTNDWRQNATTELIKHATGDWICSIEQDWFTTDWEKLLNDTFKAMETADLVGWENPTNFPYIHPAYFFIKREMLEKTSKDFAAHPEINGCDHFGMITHDVRNLQGKIVSLQDLGYKCDFSIDSDCFHLGGVNQNYLNGLNEGFEFHRPEAFYAYNMESILIDIPQDKRFKELCILIDNKLLKSFQSKDPMKTEWNKFFKL